MEFGVFIAGLLLLGCIFTPSFSLRVPGRHGGRAEDQHPYLFKRNSKVSFSSSYEEHNYTQVVDHFGYSPQSFQTFPQRYFMDKSNWSGPHNNSPIFVRLGEESNIEYQLYLNAMNENAPHFKALLVFIEHRYYGTSMPFGGEEGAYANATTMGYFTSTQALADYATVILHIKKNLSASDCPVIVFGGSYGGMLAAWFRLKYPHVSIGALASSAPILYFDDITPQYGYGSVVTKDFRDASEVCFKRINESWAMMDNLASTPQGLTNLSALFNTCESINKVNDLYDWLSLRFVYAAQYDFQRVKEICSAINGVNGSADTVTRIAAAEKYLHGSQCLNLTAFISQSPDGWDWQKCTEMVFPIGNYPREKTMFPASPFDIKSHARDCYSQYGVLPRPHWATTEFGGHNIKSVLRKFGSNIIFSNGLRDPYSSGGVLENISESIVALYTEEGTHCQDLRHPLEDDPAWLKDQRSKEIMILQNWIAQYRNNL